jgi:hypothetical protein
MESVLRRGPSRARSLTAAAVITLTATVAGPLAAAAQTPCTALAGRSIAPKLIGFPSGAGSVTSATVERVPASPARPEPSVTYCKVLGEVAPRDLTAPPIRFEVNLPESWNRKAVQYGGGGFNGVVITGLDPLRDARLDTPVPVARGFATWGTDSGHDNARLPEIQAFALNDEAVQSPPPIKARPHFRALDAARTR